MKRGWTLALGLRPRLLLAFCLVSVMPLLLFFVAESQRSAWHADRMAEDTIIHVSEVQRRRLNTELYRLRDQLLLVASRTQMRLSLDAYNQDGNQQHLQTIQRILDDALAPGQALHGIWIRDIQGRPVAQVTKPAFNAESIQVPDPGSEAEGLSLVWSPPAHPQLWLNARLELENQWIGDLHILANLDGILALLEDFPHRHIGGQTVLLLHDTQGQRRIFGQLPADELAKLQALPDGVGNAILREPHQYLSIHPLAFGLGEVLVQLSLSRIQAQLASQRHTLLLTLGLALVASLLMSLVLARIIAQPLESLSQAARRLRSHPGDLTKTKPLWGEFADLARIFNDAACVIQNYTVDLEREIADHRRTQHQLADLANTDALTGLSNRRSFLALLEQHLANRQPQDPLSLLVYLDLDGFKPVNDRYGHEAGDLVLQHIAHRLHHLVRDRDVAARLGGDEFALLLYACEGRNMDVQALTQRIEEQLAQPMTIQQHLVQVGCSVGITALAQGDSATAALRRADQAMYQRKAARRPSATADAVDGAHCR